MITHAKSTVLIDEKCAVCSKSAAFIVRKEKKHLFEIESIYSIKAKALKLRYGIAANYDRSLLLIHQGKVYKRSTAILNIMRKMKGLWPLLYFFIIVPKPIRDKLYDFFAKHRRIFNPVI